MFFDLWRYEKTFFIKNYTVCDGTVFYFTILFSQLILKTINYNILTYLWSLNKFEFLFTKNKTQNLNLILKKKFRMARTKNNNAKVPSNEAKRVNNARKSSRKTAPATAS